MLLGAGWRLARGDDALRRLFAERSFDDSAWASAQVPGHWRSVPGLESSDGPVLYRNEFELSSDTDTDPGVARRSWVVFDGMFYQGDVWLDGLYLGDTEGYFVPHSFEITDAVAAASEHVLAVELTCAPQPAKKHKRNITGVFQDGELIDRELNPGGIWRPVRIERSGPTRITELRVRCTEATHERARVELTASLDAAAAGEVTIRSSVAGIDHERSRQLTSGSNIVSWRIDVPSPALWWPWALGAQPLVDVVVEVGAAGEPTSDRREVITGLRQVRSRNWILEVNGERLFTKGATTAPTRALLAEATAGEFTRDVALAKDAGLDLLRLQAHISRPEFYEAADRAGILLWQDMPLQWAYARGLRREAGRQARAAVGLLAHHPSVALWCAHNEPFDVDLDETPSTRRRRFLIGTFLPTWNKTVLDVSMARTLEHADGSRPVVSHAGVLPHPGRGTDSHLSYGWRHGEAHDLPAALRRLPVLGRFVSDFGAQSVPVTSDWIESAKWPDLDWRDLARRHGMQRHNFDRHVPAHASESFEAWKAATQTYQAELLRHQIEALRRLKYSPTGGFCAAGFVDAQPAISTAVLDHARVPKPAHAALRAACAPVIVTADRWRDSYLPGDQEVVDLHVVSDLRRPLERCTVTATMTWPEGEQRWYFAGDVEADSVSFVGSISFVVPQTAGGITLDLDLAGPATASATYECAAREGP